MTSRKDPAISQNMIKSLQLQIFEICYLGHSVLAYETNLNLL